VLPLALVALARLVAWDARPTLVGLNALTPVLFLPAWPVAIVAGALRRWTLLAAATVVVLAHVGLELPELRAAESLPAGVRSAPHFRVFDANVLASNRDTAAFAAEVRRQRPDLLALQEATPAFLAGLDATGVLADLPYRITASRDDPFAALVASRWPLIEDDIVSSHGRPILIRATVEIEGHAVRLFAAHTVAPIAGARVEWIEDLDVLRAAVAPEHRPILVAGDFNATWGHKHFRSLLSAG
jgi:endonuclease/exonuclease/phosphatase (EEP) superfamily protein YafD